MSSSPQSRGPLASVAQPLHPVLFENAPAPVDGGAPAANAAAEAAPIAALDALLLCAAASALGG